MDVSAIVNSVKTLPDPARAEPARFELVRGGSQPQPPVEDKPKVEIATIVSELEQVSAAFSRRLSFSFNEKLGQVIVKVVDSQSNRVIKEIPPEELQHVHERIREVMGILFDEQA